MRVSNEDEYSDEDKQSEQDTNSSTHINPYTTCQHPESAKEILAKGNS